MGTLISSNALADSARRLLFLKRRYGLDIRSGLDGMRISWAVSVSVAGGVIGLSRYNSPPPLAVLPPVKGIACAK